MKVLAITSCAILIWLCPCDVTSDTSPRFLGIGYNLLTGNPDGGPSSRGGVDPGLLYTRKIFDLSNPLTIQKESRNACAQVRQVSVFYGEKSYQDKLNQGVSIGGERNFWIASFAFSLSTRFSETQQETTNERKVFQDNQITCNLGRQRFAEELAELYSFSVTQNFAASVCSLPSSYDKQMYMSFLDDWGTHVTMEVELGTKKITRYESTLASFVEHVSQTSSESVSAGGSFLGYGGSLKVDFESFRRSSSFERSFGSYQTNLLTGTPSLPEPIGLKIQQIDVALSPEYWSNTSLLTSNNLCTTSDLGNISLNLRQAISEYAAYKMAPDLTDPDLQIPLVWPRSTYGLYQPVTGCPKGGATWSWFQGRLRQDTEDFSTTNRFSDSLHLRGIFERDKNIETYFCIKGNDHSSEFDLSWPKGDYCIAKYGACPTGFHEGWLHWDDEDHNNANAVSAIRPDGVYTEDTTIYYCCRNDSLPTMAINLPNDRPFYLLRHTRSCQVVNGMHVTDEFVRWDEEYHFFGSNRQKAGGYHPYDSGTSENHRIHFCYYSPADNTIAG